MERPDAPQELIDYLVRSRGLGPSEALAMVDEVIAYFDEAVEDFVRRRHHELQAEGLRNTAIYRRISEELDTHLFRASRVSQRQIRRMVYG